jgi:transcriptional repressor NrdR
MVCIYCAEDTKVVNSRHQKKLNRVWRRRTCLNCGATFTTSEAIDLTGTITVKHLRQYEPFQRDKLFMSIFNSLKHRRTALSDATGLTDTVITLLYKDMHDAVIERQLIANNIKSVLERFDKPAAIHYAAFHSLAT